MGVAGYGLNDGRLLIWDPHYAGDAIVEDGVCATVYEEGWVSWRGLLDVFRVDSFYNIGFAGSNSGCVGSGCVGEEVSCAGAMDWSRLFELTESGQEA